MSTHSATIAWDRAGAAFSIAPRRGFGVEGYGHEPLDVSGMAAAPERCGTPA